MALVTLLTDFGTVDGYVGAMKGVVASIAPEARIVDLTHEVAPQDVRAGAWALRQATPFFPGGTIHVAVVDPGVGGARRPLLVRAAEQLYLGPDNGLLTWVAGAAAARVWALDRPELFKSPVSRTFHGRDVFASVAGHLAAGKSPESCGSRTESWERLKWPTVKVLADVIVGAVVHVDRFGNLVTNIDRAQLARVSTWRVKLGDRDIGPLRDTFSEVAEGQWLGYIGGSGNVELAIRNGNAASSAAGCGDEVRLCRFD